MAPLLLGAGPVLRVATPGPEANLVRNPDFERKSATAFPDWSPSPQGYRVAVGEGRNGTTALECVAADETGWRGASQRLALDRREVALLKVRGWSRAEAVTGGTDSGYSIYVDVVYQDGTPLWGQTANFSTGTHDWQLREVVIAPTKPIREMNVYCLFRGHAGRVWFDDLEVEELGAGQGSVLFQGTPMEVVSGTNLPPTEVRIHATGDGLHLGLAGSRVVSLQLDGRELAHGGAGGFLVRDVAANSDVFGFEAGTCAELGLKLETTIRTNLTHLTLEGRLTDTRAKDRAVMLLFALPVDAGGWLWDDDIRRSRKIEGRGEYANVNGVGAGSTGTMSTYPLATIRNEQTGLALALDMGHPAQYRLVHHAGTGQFFIAYDFGLVPESQPVAGSAAFRFVLYRFDPRWGFRSAFARLTGIFPDHFQVRAKEQGIWMPFTDVSTVQGWEDFGFRYHEGNNNVTWDDAHGILSFRYTEPMTWWMPMKPELSRT
ncbi:MAG: hypothetical protein ACYDC1_14705, partial [Limisphaerales bacterium]